MTELLTISHIVYHILVLLNTVFSIHRGIH